MFNLNKAVNLLFYLLHGGAQKRGPAVFELLHSSYNIHSNVSKKCMTLL